MNHKKVLYIGCYKDGTGYGQAAKDYILSLDVAGIDIVPRHIKLNNAFIQNNPRISQLEKKSTTRCNIVIQHCLPHQMEYCAGMKNIGLFAWETSHFMNSNWASHLNLMDEVWVINEQQKHACYLSGVTRPIHVVPHATDSNKFLRSYKSTQLIDTHKKRGSFLFYFIGEFNKRKNISTLLRAFHTEFEYYEDVELLLKVGFNQQKEVEEYCENIKSGLKNKNLFKKEIIISQRLDEESINRIHFNCDCHVTASYGEAWGISSFDAMGFGKTPIVPKSTGFLSYMDNTAGFMVDTRPETVYGYTDTFANLYTSDECWWAVDVNDLSREMRKAYNLRNSNFEMVKNGMRKANKFSYENVGSLMRGLLYEQSVQQLEGSSGGRRT